MPRTNDPGTIATGSGLTGQDTTNTAVSGANGLNAHVASSASAHEASAISVDQRPAVFFGLNVEEVLDEIAALVPPRPPTVGNTSTVVSVAGVPDWGILKLNDGQLDQRSGATAAGFDLGEAYGYYYRAPEPADESSFTVPGEDPSTDPTFNVADGTYTGGGAGTAHSGGFTRDVGGPNPITQSLRIIPFQGISGGSAVVSGTVFPANRGVLALIRWPAGGDTAAFLAQDLTTRCPAAILLGNGLASGCDGTVGGIFTKGVDGSGNFDPFAYPGEASGQYSLQELHTGLSDIDASALPAPFDVAQSEAGQVRLGKVEAAGVLPLVPGGIPVLGASTAANGGGNDNNFFRYRLPYLRDYTSATGLPFTPDADKPRYFGKPTLALNPGTDLTQAGDYPNFTQDFFASQLARFRHRFALDPTPTAATDPRESGTYILLHFRNEDAFELLVRDGTVPSDDDLFSANLVDWVSPENPTNVAADDSANDFPIANSYHVVRQSVFEDPEGAIDPAVIASTFDWMSARGLSMQVSGVSYVIIDDGTAAGPFELSSVNVDVSTFWENSFRTAEPGKTGDAFLGNMNPGILALSNFSFGEDGATPNHSTVNVLDDPTNGTRRQRLELNYIDLGATSAADGPLASDSATFNFTRSLAPNTRISFAGDLAKPAFSRDARPKVILRRPLGHESDTTTTFQFILAPADGNQLLMHSTINNTPIYGNFTAVTPPFAAGTPLASLETATKDTEERFLDEVYRYRADFVGLSSPQSDLLEGPGLGGAQPQQIDLPVRAGSAGAPFSSASWMQLGNFATDLGTLPGELQVAGLPARNPDFTLATAVKSPFPSAGMLLFPQENYTVGFRPDFATDSITQPDYSGIPTTGDRSYVRAFDVGFSRGTPTNPEGQPLFTLRIRGLQLSDFAYAAPGPGSSAVAIFVKVPGLTTWMDLGRADGDGPSKQDAFQDGAGCQVVGSLTTNGIDPETRVVYADVRVNAGPQAVLFKNSIGEVPILVKVVIKDTVAGRALNFAQGAAADDTGNQRAVVGIAVV